ncbi:hypothetical protein BY996DRAFT_7956175, partial [Phakopsora pachyrhizi]
YFYFYFYFYTRFNYYWTFDTSLFGHAVLALRLTTKLLCLIFYYLLLFSFLFLILVGFIVP